VTDQEQTERGASIELRHRTEVVEDIAKFPTLTHRHGCPNLDEPAHHACLQEADGAVVRFRLATPDELRADLERVTAERDAMREVEQAARRHANNEFCHRCGNVRDALARLDATRKATADATEEGK
jgi:hypothetical protein